MSAANFGAVRLKLKQHRAVAPGQGGKSKSFERGQAVGRALDKAIGLERTGRSDDAASILEKIVVSDPQHFQALFQLGALRSRQGRHADALRHFHRAAEARPSEPIVRFNTAIVLLASGQAAEAVTCCDKTLALRPNFPEALNARGQALRALGRIEEAAQSYQKAVGLRPDYFEALANYGCALKELRLFEQALAVFDNALEYRSDNAAIFCNRAAVLIDLDRPGEALINADKALALAPESFQAINNRGLALKLLKRPEEALSAYEAALAIDRTNAGTWANRGSALADLGRPEEAIASFDQALTLEPRLIAGLANKGIVLGEMGRFAEASLILRQAIALYPKQTSLHYDLTQLERLSFGDPVVAAMETLADDIKSLAVAERIFLHYALATVHENNANHAAAFRSQCAGATLKRGLIIYDEAAAIDEMERTRQLFDRRFFERRTEWGDSSLAPVFIIGMPRSGSTLVEQILSSHADVAGLGEMDTFIKAMRDSKGPHSGPLQFPDAVASLSATELLRIGASYAHRVCALAPSAEIIVDKMLDNFRFVGLIHLALPKARFIHIRRDPIETCLSCFSKLFSDGVGYSFDLGELGRYYQAHERLMAHWRELLPPGVILEARYEDIVADLDGQSRRIAAFCGIEWDARCLEFHKSERQVRTASKLQVRQPLFDGSSKRRRSLENYIAPLKAGLGLALERSES
jgi:tetratricopeptide (TPR) repeat protein